MDEKKKSIQNELASKLEQKAKQLREEGLSEKDLEGLSGGTWMWTCCGSDCSSVSSSCYCGRHEQCRRDCVHSSPD